MNESQLTEIRNYLLTKKLPIDILLEVQDHFIAQISSIQQEENLDFEVAFANVKESWRNELTTFYPFYFLVKNEYGLRTNFEQKIRNKQQFFLLKKSFLIALIFLIFTICFFIYFQNNFIRFLKFEIGFVFVFSFSIVFYNYIFHSFAFATKSNQLRYSIFHWQTFFAFAFANIVFQFIKPVDILILKFANGNSSFSDFLSAFLLFAVFWCFIYTSLAMLKLSQTLKKLKPFLKNFTNYDN